MSIESLLLLADGRFPDGAHAHSHGLEVAVDRERVRDTETLGAYVRARLWSSGRTDAAAARLAVSGVDAADVDTAWCLRTPSVAARHNARSLGRALARTGSHLAPGHRLVLEDGRAAVQPVVFGLLAGALGCTPDEVALGITHGLAAVLAAAGLRLLSLDPFEVHALLCDLRTDVAGVAHSVSEIANVSDMPHVSTPFGEIDIENQSELSTRLFRS